MSNDWRPVGEQHAGVFVALSGPTNSGKTLSALYLAQGMADAIASHREGKPTKGRLAVLDTEGGRTANYKAKFDFGLIIMEPPFRPERFANYAIDAESKGFDVLLIDSYTMEWTGPGGVLEWADAELKRLGGSDAVKKLSWAAPKVAHKAQVASFLQRKMPIIFSIRGKQDFLAVRGGEKVTWWQPNTEPSFPFEMTIALMLDANRKGYIDLESKGKGGMPTWKMEEDHIEIFKHGDRISADHGRRLIELRWKKRDPLGDRVATACEMTAATSPSLANVQAAKRGTADLMAEVLAANRPELHEKLTDAIKELHSRVK